MSSRIDDERIRFYLRHRELIETWAAVRKDAQQAAHPFYLSLADDLGVRASEYGEDVTVWSGEGSWSKVGLYRHGWAGGEDPLVQVCFEWSRQTTFDDGERRVGVRVQYATDPGKELRPYLGDAVREVGEKAGFGRSAGYWPAYRWGPQPVGEFWEDLSGYREGILDAIEAAWVAFAAPVDQAVARWRSETN